MGRNKSLIGIDLFSGAVGLSLGGSMAGVKVHYAVKKGPYAAQTYCMIERIQCVNAGKM